MAKTYDELFEEKVEAKIQLMLAKLNAENRKYLRSAAESAVRSEEFAETEAWWANRRSPAPYSSIEADKSVFSRIDALEERLTGTMNEGFGKLQTEIRRLTIALEKRNSSR